MKNKGYTKVGVGWGRGDKVHYGRCASGVIRYVVQGMTHPSLSIVENDNAVSISCYYIQALFFCFEICRGGWKLRTGDVVTYLTRHAGSTLRARELRQIFFYFQNDQLILG